MMFRALLIILLSFGFTVLYGQKLSNCYRNVRSKWMKSRLDSSICLPSNSYFISDILEEVDLNDDGLKDKVISWTKVKMHDGDTIFYSIYTGNNAGTYSLMRTFSNLKPLYFKSYSDDYFTGSKRLDSIKIRYIKPEFVEAEFIRNSILITIYIEATVLKKLYFVYSKNDHNWVLSREVMLTIESQNETNWKKEYDRAPKIYFFLEDFNILKYTGW
jgi:hypothetical protein